MSAWVVSKEHVDLLVQAAIAGPTDGVHWLDPGTNFSWFFDGSHREINAHAREFNDQRHGSPVLSPSQVGQIFVDECVRSVSHRYPDDDVDAGELPGPLDAYYMGPYVFEPVVASRERIIMPGMPAVIAKPATIVVIAKQIDCYEYQSCEHDDWGTSEAHAICRVLRNRLLAALPGYGQAPWGWDTRVAA